MKLPSKLSRVIAISLIANSFALHAATEQIGNVKLERIQTPDVVETSIGKLEFLDGAPTQETAQKTYDYLDTMRGVDVFLKGMPGASVQGLIDGPAALGVDEVGDVLIFDKLMDSKPYFLTGNTNSLYVCPFIDLKAAGGPIVVELPPGLLGAFNDAWFKYVADVGPFGQDKGKGGKYLILPPGYEGDVPGGYYVVRSPSYKMWLLTRASITNGLEETGDMIKEQMKVYPLAQKDNPPKTKFISGSGKAFNTVHTNDYTFYEHLNEVIQYEPYEFIDVETRGLLASIGIEKGKPFAPDARMKKILTDAVAIGNASARSIVWYPRTEGNLPLLEDVQVYPGQDSAWIMPSAGKNVFFTGKDKHTMNSDARVMFHYPYTVVTPAMAVKIPGKGSDYAMAYVDADKQAFDGSKTYKLEVPANPPAKDFWAVTLYDSQTRSQLQTNQPLPTLGSQDKGLKENPDGSMTIYFGPEAPKGSENNWVQTVPGKSFFVIFRMYGPEKEWLEKKWRPSEVQLVK